MSGGIMGWIFGQVVNVILPVIQQLFAFLIQTMSIPILKVFGFSSKEFYDTFAFISTTSKGVNVLDFIYSDVIQPFAMGLMIIIMCYGLYRMMFSRHETSDLDEPLGIILKAAACGFLIIKLKDIIDYFTAGDGILAKFLDSAMLAGTPYTDLMSYARAMFGNVSLTPTTTAQLPFTDGLTTFIFPWVAALIQIILLVFILSPFIKTLLVIIERYFYYHFTILFAPIAIATGVSKKTDDILKRYIRMIISAAFAMVISAIVFRLYARMIIPLVTFQVGENEGWVQLIFRAFIANVISRFILQIDQWLDKMGLPITQKGAGRSPLGGLGGAMMLKSMFGGGGRSGGILNNAAQTAKNGLSSLLGGGDSPKSSGISLKADAGAGKKDISPGTFADGTTTDAFNTDGKRSTNRNDLTSLTNNAMMTNGNQQVVKGFNIGEDGTIDKSSYRDGLVHPNGGALLNKQTGEPLGTDNVGYLGKEQAIDSSTSGMMADHIAHGGTGAIVTDANGNDHMVYGYDDGSYSSNGQKYDSFEDMNSALGGQTITPYTEHEKGMTSAYGMDLGRAASAMPPNTEHQWLYQDGNGGLHGIYAPEGAVNGSSPLPLSARRITDEEAVNNPRAMKFTGSDGKDYYAQTQYYSTVKSINDICASSIIQDGKIVSRNAGINDLNNADGRARRR